MKAPSEKEREEFFGAALDRARHLVSLLERPRANLDDRGWRAFWDDVNQTETEIGDYLNKAGEDDMDEALGPG